VIPFSPPKGVRKNARLSTGYGGEKVADAIGRMRSGAT
jgi:hypothetical protein